MSEERSQELVKWDAFDAVRTDGKSAITSSVIVSEVFGKRHASVLRSIDDLIKDDDVSSQHFFVLAEYSDAQGKKRKSYTMNKDGFALLAMGFSGEKARKFKLAYIKQFNRMEETLKNIILQGMTLAYENQNKALMGTVREQECIIHDYKRALVSLEKQNAAHQPVHEFGDATSDGRLKTEYRRPTHTVARTFSQMQRTIKDLNNQMEQMRFFGLHCDDINANSGNTGF